MVLIFLGLKAKAKIIKKDIKRVYIVSISKDTPWYVKMVGGIAIVYALSPIDFIPDFIPVLGYLDDLIILPLLIMLTIKLVPKEIWDRTEEQAKNIWHDGKPKKFYYAIPIVLVWFCILALIFNLIVK